MRDERSGYSLTAPQSAVGLLLMVNIGLFVLDQFLDGSIARRLGLQTDLFDHPLNFYQLLTYGFVHNPNVLSHILFNLLALWMFGTDVEGAYGKREFLAVYLTAVVVAGAACVASHTFVFHDVDRVVGASGAITCILALFVLRDPRRTLLFFGAIPVPAWFLGVLWVVQDMAGYSRVVHGGVERTAFEAHLAGALFAVVYFKAGWNLGRLLPTSLKLPTSARAALGGRPKLKVHQPGEEPVSLDAEVDRILAKISDSGTDSLSAEERRTLERASARYQKRRT